MICANVQSSPQSVFTVEPSGLFASDRMYESDGPFETSLECGRFAIGLLWAVGIEIASAAFIYGLWRTVHFLA